MLAERCWMGRACATGGYSSACEGWNGASTSIRRSSTTDRGVPMITQLARRGGIALLAPLFLQAAVPTPPSDPLLYASTEVGNTISVIWARSDGLAATGTLDLRLQSLPPS